ncbi:MAG: phosphopantetheine-binding protein, partial [Tumebacillaceae bacterium]
DAIPLTANGKVDRKALPVPTKHKSQATHAKTEPRTATEQKIAEIWSRVLQIGPVSVHDDFFDLGGDSLIATRVLAQINGAFSIRLPLRAFFDQPTIAGLAEEVEQLRDSSQVGSGSTEDKMAHVLQELENFSEDDIERMLLELAATAEQEGK